MTEILSKQITNIFETIPDILAAYIIGSYAAKKYSKESDFDLAVIVQNKKTVHENTIYKLLFPLRFPADLDLSVVDSCSSPLFLFQIVKKGKLVYFRNKQALERFEAFVLYTYYDTQHIRNIYQSYLSKKFLREKDHYGKFSKADGKSS